jgi:multidrug resistance efflux pump
MAWGVAAALVALAAGATALIRQASSRKAEAARNSAPAEAATPAGVEVTLPAQIRAQHTIAVAAPVAGHIEEFRADVGDEVYEGQLLARISNQTVESSVENAGTALENASARVSRLESSIIASRLEASRARADAQRARSEMERTDRIWRRQKMLMSEGATPRLAYEKSETEAGSARAEHESLETLARQAEERVEAMTAELENSKKLQADKAQELEDAEEHLRQAEVHAPANGLVVARRGEVGKEFGEDGNRDIFVIAVNTAELEATVEAHPSAVARLAAGQRAMLFFADIPGEGVEGTVTEAKGDRATIRFTSPSPLIRPGMTAQVRVTLR